MDFTQSLSNGDKFQVGLAFQSCDFSVQFQTIDHTVNDCPLRETALQWARALDLALLREIIFLIPKLKELFLTM